MLALLQTELVPKIPLAEWTESGVDWITDTFDGAFDLLDTVIDIVIGSLEYLLLSPPALLMVAILGVIAFFLASWRVALFTVLGLLFVISLDLWEAAMQTLALVLAATVVALAIGIPIGIVAAKSAAVEGVIRPVLDVAQTMPAFVYLVPIVVLLGIGAGPALIATVIFAMPPAVRLTMLGIQQVPKDTVEAAHAFGATPWQTLVKVELPLSLKTIMAGVNQVIMLSLSMVVIAGLAGAGGLGEPVVTGLSQLNVGISFVGGVGIVVIAIMLDRVTRAMTRRTGRARGGSFRAARNPSRMQPGERRDEVNH
jgi:glycine betaine/proline transport system permease protein